MKLKKLIAKVMALVMVTGSIIFTPITSEAKTSVSQPAQNVFFYVKNSDDKNVLVKVSTIEELKTLAHGKTSTENYSYSYTDNLPTTGYGEGKGFTVEELVNYINKNQNVIKNLTFDGNDKVYLMADDSFGKYSRSYTADELNVTRKYVPGLYEGWSKFGGYENWEDTYNDEVNEYKQKAWQEGEEMPVILATSYYSGRTNTNQTESSNGVLSYVEKNNGVIQGCLKDALDDKSALTFCLPISEESFMKGERTAYQNFNWVYDIKLDMENDPDVKSLGTVPAATAKYSLSDDGNKLTVELESSVEGAKIYYDTNESNYSTTSAQTLYTEPFEIDVTGKDLAAQPITIYTRTVKEGYDDAGWQTLKYYEVAPTFNTVSYSKIGEDVVFTAKNTVTDEQWKAWADNITSVSVKEPKKTSYTETKKYKIDYKNKTLTLNKDIITKAGSHSILIKANGYSNRTITRNIKGEAPTIKTENTYYKYEDIVLTFDDSTGIYQESTTVKITPPGETTAKSIATKYLDRSQPGKLIIKSDYFSQGVISDNGDYKLTLTNSNYTPNPQTVTINISDEKEDNDNIPSIVDGYYQITNKDEFNWFKKQINVKGNQSINAKLTNDIDLENESWTPISPSGNKWAGTFDGNGYAITGIYVNGQEGNTDNNYYGLFGKLNGATIKNLTVKGKVTGNLYVGGIAGSASSTSIIENCISNVEVNGKQAVGGIVGSTLDSAQIVKCINYGNVSSTLAQAGGIAGSANGELVDECVNKGNITAKENNVGGIVGYDYKTVTNCYNTGKITGSSESSDTGIGGIVGYHANTKSISNCYNVGNVIADNDVKAKVGQIVGYVNSSSTIDGYYKQELNINGIGYISASTKDNTISKTESEMKTDEFLQLLGDLFTKDNEGLNDGYPILSWQQTDKNIVVKFEDGNDVITKEVKQGQVLNYTPETPVKSGYTFVGWYENTDDINTSYQNNKVVTTNTTYKAKWAHVTMLGAQGKKVVDGKSGIRFGTQIYNDGDEVVEKGTIILPIKLLPEGETLTLNTPRTAKSVAKVNYEVNTEKNYVTYLGTLVGIKTEQFNEQITASAYVIYKDKAGNQYTVYAPYKNGSISINMLLGI